MDDKENPYVTPEFDDDKHQNEEFVKTTSVIPGKLVALFGCMSLMIPSVYWEETDELMVNAIMYGVPGGIAAIIFGLKNISKGTQTLGDYVGIACSVSSFIAGISFLVI